MFISKASLQDGVMRWSAVNSDTDWDLYEEKMTLDLYEKMLEYIQNDTPPPTPFKDMVCSGYWCGGMPYVSISHYPDLEGKAVPGQVLELFVDGTQLKARGVLFNNKLGNKVWKSLKEDEKIGVDEDRIRISIAFLDLSHKHGESGAVFKRESVESVCPGCLRGEKNKVYLDGYLVHLALTRVPVNPRTIMQPEDIMAKKAKIQTRQEDAVSIVGEELAEEIHESAVTDKSDVLVEMSETDDVEQVLALESSHGKKDEEELTAKDIEDADASDEKKKDKKDYKSLTAEDIKEIVKSTLAETFTKPAEIIPVVEEKSALDLATDELYNSINKALAMPGATIEQKLESINPSLQEVGNAITVLVKESSGVISPVVQPNDQSMVLEAISALTKTVSQLAEDVAIVKEKSKEPVIPVSRIPAPRSIQPVVSQSQTQQPVNPGSVHNIVRRSVSNQLQPE